MRSARKTATLLTLAGVVASGCGGNEEKDNSAQALTAEESLAREAGVVESDAQEVAIAGTLQLTGLGLSSETRGVLAFNLVSGFISGDPTRITVATDGTFRHTLNKTDKALAQVRAAIARGSIANDEFALFATLFGVTEDQVKSYYEQAPAEILQMLNSIVGDIEAQGGPKTILVAYTPSDDKIAEAQSFQFIGLPIGTDALTLLSVANLRGDIGLGAIDLSAGDDAKSELGASDAFDLGTDQLAFMASAGNMLKSLKNTYMNDDWSAQPFFMWSARPAQRSSFEGAALPPDQLTFGGTGFYIGSMSDTPFTYEQLCASDANARKVLEIYAPDRAPITVSNNSDTPEETTQIAKMSNESNLRATTQGSGDETQRICYADQFYAREDDTRQFMINFGSGGGIQGQIPAGLWRMSYDGTEIGRFDMSAAYPLASDGHPLVPVPAIQLTRSGDQYTGATVELYSWDQDTAALKKIEDLSIVRRVLSNIDIAVQTDDGDELGRGSEVTWNRSSLQVTFDDPISAQDAVGPYLSYQIGTSTYRFEIRVAPAN